MISYRLRGLVNLHVLATTVANTAFFLLAAVVAHASATVTLAKEIDLLPYVIAVIVGMVMSGRFLTPIGSRFHRLTWVDAASLSYRQVTVVALVLFTLIVATKDRSVSRLFIAAYLMMSWVLLLFVNCLLPRLLARVAFTRTHRLPTLFMGNAKALKRLGTWISGKEHLGIQPVGFLSDDEYGEQSSSSTRFLGPTSALAATLEEKGVGQVILLEVPANGSETASIIETCQDAGCRLLIYNNITDRVPAPMIPIVEDGLFFYSVQEEPLEDPMNRAIKRIYDIAVSLPVVVLILPPLSLFVWLGQRFSAPGPLFFVRRRGGQRRHEFMMLKFRSMYHAKPDESGEAVQARSSDDRIFPFGRFLRKTSLDEFPQFLNVLMGEMSVVGPRPHLPKHDHEFSRVARSYRSRHLVKPGITGLAQTSGLRGEISDPALLQRRVQSDIHYITHWSIWLDLQITVKTILQVVFPPKSAF